MAQLLRKMYRLRQERIDPGQRTLFDARELVELQRSRARYADRLVR